MCFDFLYNFFETFLTLSTIQRDIITNVHRSSCKLLLFLPDFNATIFLDRFSKNIYI